MPQGSFGLVGYCFALGGGTEERVQKHTIGPS